MGPNFFNPKLTHLRSFASLFVVEKLSLEINLVSEKKVMPMTVLFAFFVYFGIAATFYF